MQVARALTCGRFSLSATAFCASARASGNWPAWAKDLGVRHAVLRVVGIEANGLARLLDRLFVLLGGRQHAAVEPVCLRVAGLQRQRLLQIAAAEIVPALHRRLARSTNDSAEIGSRMICDTFIEALPGLSPGLNAKSTPRSGYARPRTSPNSLTTNTGRIAVRSSCLATASTGNERSSRITIDDTLPSA